MTVIRDATVSGTGYLDVLRRARLHDAFEEAWDVDLEDHDRGNAGLGAVSEDLLIEKTLAVADGVWTFSMNINQFHPQNESVYHLTPVDTSETDMTLVADEVIDDIKDAVQVIRENRPDNPEMVSYALDDVEYALGQLSE